MSLTNTSHRASFLSYRLAPSFIPKGPEPLVSRGWGLQPSPSSCHWPFRPQAGPQRMPGLLTCFSATSAEDHLVLVRTAAPDGTVTFPRTCQGHKEPVASTFKSVGLFSGARGPKCLHQKSPELQGLDAQLCSALTTADGASHSQQRSPGSSWTVHLCLQAHSAHMPLMLPRMGMRVP